MFFSLFHKSLQIARLVSWMENKFLKWKYSFYSAKERACLNSSFIFHKLILRERNAGFGGFEGISGLLQILSMLKEMQPMFNFSI